MFWLTEVTFLGHVVTKEGIKVDPQKINAMIERPRPTNVAEEFYGFSKIL